MGPLEDGPFEGRETPFQFMFGNFFRIVGVKGEVLANSLIMG